MLEGNKLRVFQRSTVQIEKLKIFSATLGKIPEVLSRKFQVSSQMEKFLIFSHKLKVISITGKALHGGGVTLINRGTSPYRFFDQAQIFFKICSKSGMENGNY